jgi:NADH dehydrogenase
MAVEYRTEQGGADTIRGLSGAREPIGVFKVSRPNDMNAAADTAGERPRVVIVGGGFGGLQAAKALSRVPVEITLVDRENHHCFQPLLYQVASASLSPADVAWPIRAVLSRQRNVRVVMAEATGIDRKRRAVTTASGLSYPFDYLILASGVTHSYFGHDEWAAAAPGLKRIEDAIEIRNRILLAFERAETEESEAERYRLLSFVIVGGGPTGVEMAGAIADTARFALSRDFRKIDPGAAHIMLIEAGPRLLPAFPEPLAQYAEHSLRRMGVAVLTATRVTACHADGVTTETGAIPTATIVWAAGIQASPAGQWLGAGQDNAGRINVAGDLSVPGEPDIFAIGDTAHVLDPAGQPVPGIAPAAKQMGEYVARLIAARVARSVVPGAFAYRHRGDLATIGRKSAIVWLGKFRLTGFAAWLFWCFIHIYYLIGARNRMSVALSWIWDYVTFQRGARLIYERELRRPDEAPEGGRAPS